jgi:hypothetical protein
MQSIDDKILVKVKKAKGGARYFLLKIFNPYRQFHFGDAQHKYFDKLSTSAISTFANLKNIIFLKYCFVYSPFSKPSERFVCCVRNRGEIQKYLFKFTLLVRHTSPRHFDTIFQNEINHLKNHPITCSAVKEFTKDSDFSIIKRCFCKAFSKSSISLR